MRGQWRSPLNHAEGRDTTLGSGKGIRNDGTDQIREDVRNDKLTINKAYDMIRKMELGEDEQSGRKLSAGQIKVLKSVLSEDTLTALEAMGDDLGALLNAAVERFIDEPREKRALKGLDGDIPPLLIVERYEP